MSTVTAKGQITIPKPVREALGLVPGSQVDFVVESGRAILQRRVAPEVFERWRGRLRGRLPGSSVDETVRMLRGERDSVDTA